MKITLLGEPISTGSLYRSHCKFGHPVVYMTAKGKQLKQDYQWQAKSQYKKPVTTEPVELTVELFFKTKRKSDVDNFSKILLDSLSGIVYEDDVQIQKLATTKNYDKENPRIEVTIKNYEKD